MTRRGKMSTWDNTWANVSEARFGEDGLMIVRLYRNRADVDVLYGTRDPTAHREVRRGVNLAKSDEIQGLVAQGRTFQEALEIARDVAKKLIEAGASSAAPCRLPQRPLTIP